MEDFIDNRAEDPDFEPQRKKHKKNTDIISNELMLYIITKFGKNFFTETDKVERKHMCEMIADDLVNEKSVIIEHEHIYDNLMTQKRTFLREKKKTGKTQNAKWPFFEAFLSLGSCIRSESSSSSDKKHSSSSSDKKHSKDSKDSKSKSRSKSSSSKSSSSRSSKSSSHKEEGSKDESVNLGLKVLFGGSFSEKNTESDQSEYDGKNEVMGNSPSTSTSFNATQSTPKADKTDVRSKGFLFDKSIGVEEKIGYFFGKYENEDNSQSMPSQAPVSNSKQPPEKFNSEAEMLAYLDTLIPKTDEASLDDTSDTQDDPVNTQVDSGNTQTGKINTQIDPMDYINSSQPVSEEDYASQYPATQQFQNSQEIGDLSHDASDIEEKKYPTPDNSLNNTTKSLNDDDNLGQEKMITDEDDPLPINNNNDDQKQNSINNIMDEVFANKAFDKIDDFGANAEEIQELRELFNENESRISAMLELEEKMFKLQQEIVKSELKFKAKLVRILENMSKNK